MILFCDRGCPFTHRVLALLSHLDVTFDLRESLVGLRPDGLAHYSPSGRMPLLVHDDLVVSESRVMLDYLAERFDFANAYPVDVRDRTAHRYAMTIVDNELGPIVGAPRAQLNGRFGELLDTLEAVTATTAPRPTLLALHLAPLWRAFRAWAPDGAVTHGIRQRPALCDWLEEAATLDCIARTAVDPATLAEDLQRARDAGLLPKAV